MRIYSLRLSFDVFWPFVLRMIEPNMCLWISSKKLDWLKQLLWSLCDPVSYDVFLNRLLDLRFAGFGSTSAIMTGAKLDLYVANSFDWI